MNAAGDRVGKDSRPVDSGARARLQAVASASSPLWEGPPTALLFRIFLDPAEASL